MSFLKQPILIVILFSTLYAPNFLHSQNIQKEIKAISELKLELEKLLTYAPYIDSDTESYWAYKQADSLLNAIDSNNFDFSKAIFTTYKAYSHIFHGMSYTKTIIYQSGEIKRGLEPSLSEYTNILCENKLTDKSDFIDCELRANFSMVYFYKVSNMPAYSRLFEMYKTESNHIKKINEKYDTKEAYSINSIRLKKLNFMILGNFIADLHIVNNPEKKSVSREFAMLLNSLAVKMDSVSSQEQNILKWNTTEFEENLISEINIISEMIALLNKELKMLTNS